MSKTEKELAFLRGIYVEPEWTAKFTELFNEGVVVEGFSTITYLNAGAGGHAIEMGDKLGKDVDIFPVCENAELREIAASKAETVKSDIEFATELPMARSELVVADASLVAASDIDEFLRSAAECASGKFVFFLPTAGSFGEVFSYLWEVLLELGLEEKAPEVESLISGLRTVSQAEEAALALNLTKVESISKNDVLEFEDGAKFLESPLVRHFLLPKWLGFLEKDDKDRVMRSIAAKIDEEGGGMTFRMAVKATVISGVRTG